MSSSILVTGAAGYIGSVLVRQLLNQGHRVIGLDSLLFGGESLLEIISHPRFRFVKGDIRDRDLVAGLLTDSKAVVHLAALVGDKACAEQPEQASEVMGAGSRQLYELCGTVGIGHFIFASTCSNYGVMEGGEREMLDENASLRPQSHYAHLKVDFEQYLMAEKIVPRTILRFATVYGLSPRMRFDLSVNHFTRDLARGQSLEVYGADSWRPYCHVGDLCNSVAMSIVTGPKYTDGKVFNVGDNYENYTKRDLIEKISEQIPGVDVTFTASADDDPRNYRVDFSRVRTELGFQVQKRVPHGIAEILQLVRTGILPDYDSPRYRNA